MINSLVFCKTVTTTSIFGHNLSSKVKGEWYRINIYKVVQAITCCQDKQTGAFLNNY